ncbi:MAG: phosphotransferase [Bacilli bacterium]|jgi:thiamine kinase-like enzyme|nr:phosphotransferase [Bacilli bacterium]
MATKTEKDFGTLVMEHHDKKIYRKDGVITKVFSHTAYAPSDVLKEAMNQQYALECGFAAPRVYDVFPVGADWAIASEEIKGQTLEQLMKDHPENTKKYIAELVKIQVSLLAHLSDNLKLPKLKDKLNAYITQSGLDATTRYDLHVRLEKMPNHYKFCHGDITPHNIIVSDDGKSYVLDWAHATRGNSSADAAMTYLLFILDGKTKEAEMYLKEFCKKTDIAAQYIQEWVSVVSATKLATCKDEAMKAILIRNISVVEY